MTIRDVILIVCSVGGIQSIFLGIDFLIFFDKKSISSKILGALFLMLGLRVIKSTLYIFTEAVPLWFLNVGFAAHYFVGPLLLFYILSMKNTIAWKPLNWIHFIPGGVILLAAPWLSIEGFWYQGGYTALLFQSIIYLAITLIILLNLRNSFSKLQFTWGLILTLGVLVFVFIYFSNYELRLNPYYYAPIVYSAVVYFLSFHLIKKRNSIFNTDAKYKNINLDDEQAENYKSKILVYYKAKSPYLDNEYSLSKLSEELNIPKHLLSLLFGSKLKMSFVDFTNSYRVEKAKEILKESPNFTVSSVAFDCGFNSLSSFNQAFKKFTKTTPSKYREKHTN
ncbi:MAG: helix-turn-helix domain-containing protein [Fulvivirga sp.]|uniref:helix-turn-helix domain-containing protein n=1 Tax=Fulvivirga sp. TaxID=1931237 RepID=UPI0032EDC951